MNMDKETLEMITDIADLKGFYEEKCYMLEGLLQTLIDMSTLDYSGKHLCIDHDDFTALLRAYANDEVKDRIEALLEAKKAGEEE